MKVKNWVAASERKDRVQGVLAWRAWPWPWPWVSGCKCAGNNKLACDRPSGPGHSGMITREDLSELVLVAFPSDTFVHSFLRQLQQDSKLQLFTPTTTTCTHRDEMLYSGRSSSSKQQLE